MSIRVGISINSEYGDIPIVRLAQPVRIAVCCVLGLDLESCKVISDVELMYRLELDVNRVDRTISRLREEVTSPDSVLNSLERTRRVFSRAEFRIFSKSGLVAPDMVFVAPENAEYEEEAIPTTSKLSLPPNSTHSPVRVVFVDGSKQPIPDSSDLNRSLFIQIPAQLIDDGEEATEPMLSSLVAEMDSLLSRPAPIIPQSLLDMQKLVAN